MAETRSVGLASIKLGAVAVDGSMGTTLAILGLTYQDTAALSQDAYQTADIFAEEQDEPVESFDTPGLKRVKYSIMNYSPTTLAQVFGGTVTGTAPNDVWNAPSIQPDIYQSVEIITKNGLKIQIPKGKVTAVFNGQFRKRNVLLIDIDIRVMMPDAVGVAPVMISKAS